MTEQEKQLLLKDLCGRLPYKSIVHVEWDYKDEPPHYKSKHKEADRILEINDLYEIWNVKPYLRPMPSMTEEEFHDIIIIDNKRGIFSSRHLTLHLDGEVIDYLNSKMFDWRNLIGKGLAIEAPEGMYDLKDK